MWPWGHLAVGYLLYAAVSRRRFGGRPDALPAVAVALGTQLPDLVDKPLAYWLTVLPGGRSLAHSLLIAVPVCLAVVYAAHEFDRLPTGTAFGIGYLSHPFADALQPLLMNEFSELTFLVWPLLELPPSEVTTLADYPSRLAAELSVLQTGGAPAMLDTFALQLWLTLAVALVWARDGMPPLGAVRGWLSDSLSQ